MLCYVIVSLVSTLGEKFAFFDRYGLIEFSIGFGILSIRDIMFGKGSLGYKIFGLRLCDTTTNKVPEKTIIVKRSIISVFTLGIDLFPIMFAGKTIGDMIYKTKVVDNSVF